MGSHWNLRTRLMASAAALVAATVLWSVFSLTTIGGLASAMRESSEQTTRQMQLAGSLRAGFQRMRATAHAGQVAVVIGLLEKDSPMAGQCSACHSADMIDKHNRGLPQAGDEVQAHLRQLQSLARTTEDRQRIGVIGESVNEWRTLQWKYQSDAASGKLGVSD